MLWSTRRLCVVCGFFTLILLTLPKLYFISQQSVLYRQLVLNEVNKFTKFFPENSEKNESNVILPPAKPLMSSIITQFNSTLETLPITKPEEEKKKSSDKLLNVILLAYHRTGSSLTGEILSLIPHSAYFFEPLYYTDILMKSPSIENHRNVLNAIFNCDIKILDKMYTKSSLNILRRLFGTSVKNKLIESPIDLERNCKKSEVKIAKTIRLKLDSFIEGEIGANTKIIHLVRDPRAMLSSVYQATIWREEDRTPEKACEMLTREIIAAEALSSDVYLRVKYEDLVGSPEETCEKIFKFLGVDVPEEILFNYLTTHMKAETNPKVMKFAGEYFSTIRNSSFNYNHWREEVSQEFIVTVETYCEWVMEKLGYDVMT